MLVFYKNYLIYDWSTNNNNNSSEFANSTIRIRLSTMIEAFEVGHFLIINLKVCGCPIFSTVQPYATVLFSVTNT